MKDLQTAKFMNSIMNKRNRLGLSSYPIDMSGNILKPTKRGRLVKATRKDFRRKDFDSIYD